jgi:tRNA-specific 2-thiouridylase
MCNSEVKFKVFLDEALEHGFDMIATGHYARIEL